MKIDWSKSIKKASITLAQVIVGAVVGLSFTQNILAVVHITPSPEQLLQVQMAVAGLIGGAIEFIRSFLKQKTGWVWL